MESILCCIEIKKKQRNHFSQLKDISLYTPERQRVEIVVSHLTQGCYKIIEGGGCFSRKQNKATGHEWVKCLKPRETTWLSWNAQVASPDYLRHFVISGHFVTWNNKKSSSQITVAYLFSKESDSVHTCTYSFISHPENDKTVFQSFNA